MISLKEILDFFLFTFFISSFEQAIFSTFITNSIVMIKDGHCVDSEEAHVFGDGEGHVAEIVFVVENDGVLQLSYSPCDILGVCK